MHLEFLLLPRSVHDPSTAEDSGQRSQRSRTSCQRLLLHARRTDKRMAALYTSYTVLHSVHANANGGEVCVDPALYVSWPTWSLYSTYFQPRYTVRTVPVPLSRQLIFYRRAYFALTFLGPASTYSYTAKKSTVFLLSSIS